MKLWLLRPIEGLTENPWEPWYDKAFGFVIRAETERAARTLATQNAGDEVCSVQNSIYRVGRNPWMNDAESTCIELTIEGPEEVILEDFASA